MFKYNKDWQIWKELHYKLQEVNTKGIKLQQKFDCQNVNPLVSLLVGAKTLYLENKEENIEDKISDISFVEINAMEYGEVFADALAVFFYNDPKIMSNLLQKTEVNNDIKTIHGLRDFSSHHPKEITSQIINEIRKKNNWVFYGSSEYIDAVWLNNEIWQWYINQNSNAITIRTTALENLFFKSLKLLEENFKIEKQKNH